MIMKYPKTAAALPLLLPLAMLAACGGSDCPPENLVGGGGDGGGDGIGATNFVSIGDVILPEGDAGIQAFQFPVTLNAPLSTAITVTFTTLADTATGGADEGDTDYVERSGALMIPPGTTQTSIAIDVRGDYDYEGDELFLVNLTGVEGASITIGDSQAVGTLVDDDGNTFSIADVTGIEGDVTHPLFWFEVTLSTPQEVPVSVEYVTKDGTADNGRAPDDYIYRRDALTFAPGETVKQFEIRVVGDLEVESDEFFEVILFDPVGPNTGIADGQAIGLILDDDTEEQLDRAVSDSNASAPQLAGVSPFAYAVWQDDRSGGSDIYFSRSLDHGLNWSNTDRRLDTGAPGAGSASSPQIAAEEDYVFVVWEDSRNGKPDIYFNRSLDNGATWLASDVRIDTDVAGESASTRPRISCSGERVYVVWIDWRSATPSVRLNSSFDAGVTWMASDRKVNDPPDDKSVAAGAEVCSTGSYVYVVWSDDRDGASDIYFDASWNGGFDWLATDRRLDSTMSGTSRSDNPRIACDDGNVYVVWQDERWGEPDVFFNRSTDSGSTWMPFDLRLNSDPAGTSRSTNPSLCCDGERVAVVWEAAKIGKHEDIRFTSSEDAGTTWRGNARVDRADDVGSAGSFEPQVAMSAQRAVVTWSDERNGERDVYVGWIEDGESQFTHRIIRLDRDVPGAARSQHPRIVNDGSSFHVVWEDERDTMDVLFRTVYLP